MLHGGDLTEAMAQYGGERSAWLDLSTGINPHSWPLPDVEPRFWKALPNKADEAALLLAARQAYNVPRGAGIVVYFECEDLDERFAALHQQGSASYAGCHTHTAGGAASGLPG